MTLTQTCARITVPDEAIARETQRRLDNKTKPRRSLGRLEDVACQVAAARGLALPPLPTKAVVVMAADHGVADEGVRAYPAEVTAQMLLNFARGGAAINVLARQAGARVVVLDAGVAAEPFEAPDLVVCRLGAGTANIARGPAMTREVAVRAIEQGAALAE